MTLIEQYMLETPKRLLEMIDSSARLFREVKDKAYGRIIIAGSGTSHHSGVQVREYMQGMLGVEVSAMYPFMVTEDYLQALGGNVLLIGISQGGGSYSTYNAMKTAQRLGIATASMAGIENAYIDEVADYVLTVPCGEENAGAKTKGFYCAKMNLILMALEMAKAQNKISAALYDAEIEGLRQAAKGFQKVYEQSEVWIEAHKEELAAAKEIRITSSSDLYGDILEGALKLLETLRVPVTAYEFEEFIHGIYNAIDEDSMLFIIDTGKEPRVPKMVEVLSGWTDKVYVIGRDVAEGPNNLRVDMAAHEVFQTFQAIIPLQLICSKIPPLKGVDPSIPKDPQFHMKLGSKHYNK